MLLQLFTLHRRVVTFVPGVIVVIDRAHLIESVLAETCLATGEPFGSRSGANLPKPGFPGSYPEKPVYPPSALTAQKPSFSSLVWVQSSLGVPVSACLPDPLSLERDDRRDGGERWRDSYLLHQIWVICNPGPLSPNVSSRPTNECGPRR